MRVFKNYFFIKSCWFYCFFFFLFLFSDYSISQTLPPVVNYTTKDYESHSQNWSVIQDQRGILYFANGDGRCILEFDGKTWNKLLLKNNHTILSLDIDKNGRIYVGALGEFGYMQPDSSGNQEYVSLSKLLPDSITDYSNVWQTIVLGDKVFFRTTKYLFLYENNNLKVIFPKSFFHRPFVIDNTLLVVDKQHGLFKYSDDSLVLIPNSEILIKENVYSILPYDEDRLLIATKSNGIFLFNTNPGEANPRQEFKIDFSKELSESYIYGGLKLRSGDLAFSTENNGILICSKEGKLKTHISRKEGLQNEKVWFAYQDNHGMLWLALNNGISKVDPERPITIAREGKEFNGAIYGMERHHGELYIATSLGVYRINTDNDSSHQNHDNIETFQYIDGFGGSSWSLLSKDGDLLVATGYAGLNVMGAPVHKKVLNKHIYTLSGIKGRQDIVLAGGRSGLTVIKKEKKNWREFLHLENIPEIERIIPWDELSGEDSIRFWLSLRKSGTALVTFDKAFLTYHVELFDTLNGLPSGTISPLKVGDGILFRTIDGLFQYQGRLIPGGGESIKNDFKPENDLNAVFGNKSSVNHCIKDQFYNEWFVINNKPVYYRKDKTGNSLFDSIPFLGLDIGQITVVYPDENGICWFGGKDGLAKYDANIKKDYQQNFSAHIRKVVLGKDSLIFTGQVSSASQSEPVFSFKYNSVSFSFSASFYEAIDQLKFSYMLEGYDESFSSWTTGDKAVYTNLNEGSYTFRVKAKNIYHVESPEVVYSFTVLPPWYRTWWAYTFYFCGSIVLFFAGINLNSKRLQKEKSVLEAIVSERTAEAFTQKEVIEEKNKVLENAYVEIAQKNKDITDSIQYAKRIQKAVLPLEEDIYKAFPDSFIFFKPKDIVSGDFYWFAQVGDHSVLAVADCTGHGVPGAFMSMIGSNLLNQIVLDNNVTSPAVALAKIDHKIITSLKQSDSDGNSKDGMDIALCAFELNKKYIQYAGAYRPLIIVRKGNLIEYNANKLTIGSHSQKDKQFTDNNIQLEEGDTVYLFTDGFADQFGGERGKKFMSKRFKELLLFIQPQSMKEQKQVLNNTFMSWKGELEQVDDICVIGIRV